MKDDKKSLVSKSTDAKGKGIYIIYINTIDIEKSKTTELLDVSAAGNVIHNIINSILQLTKLSIIDLLKPLLILSIAANIINIIITFIHLL